MMPFDILSLLLGIVATVLWFKSYRVVVPEIAPGLEELDKIHVQSKALSAQSLWNNRAAFCTTGA